MTYDIEMFHPSAVPGAGAQTESLGVCRIITKHVFVTITEHSGDARLVLLDELAEVDRTHPRVTTVTGREVYPRRVDLPTRIFVETASGHARVVSGDRIARLVASKREGPAGRISW